MKNKKEQLDYYQLGYDLLNSCGGRLNKRQTKEFFKHRKITDEHDINFITQTADQLISQP